MKMEAACRALISKIPEGDLSVLGILIFARSTFLE